MDNESRADRFGATLLAYSEAHGGDRADRPVDLLTDFRYGGPDGSNGRWRSGLKGED